MTHTALVRTIGTQIRAGRARLAITRKQLAQLAGVSERYLNELENGEANASIAILAKVADALGEDTLSLLAPVPAPDRRPLPQGPVYDLLARMSPVEQEGALPILAQYLEERRRCLRGVALLGLRGSGKSTLGRRLAERHALPFVSVTGEIEQRAGMSLADLFNLGGPDAYRSLENDVVSDLIRRDDRIVLETAGGIVGNRDALDMILASFKTVWLKAAPEEHLARVAGQGDTRPMRGNSKALDHLRALLGSREPDYARAECVLDTSGRSIEGCLAELESLAAPALQ